MEELFDFSFGAFVGFVIMAWLSHQSDKVREEEEREREKRYRKERKEWEQERAILWSRQKFYDKDTGEEIN